MNQDIPDQKAADKPELTESEQTAARVDILARKLRHIGYAMLGGLAAAITVFLFLQIFYAMQDGQIVDPVTGQTVNETIDKE